MNRRLTEHSIRKLKPLERRHIYRDSTLRGFGVEVMPSGHKSYLIDGRIRRGRTRRIHIGTVGTMTIKEARAKARELLSQMQQGIDPVEVGRGERAEQAHKRALDVAGQKTLSSVWEEFIEHRELKDKTLTDYKYTYNNYLSDWHRIPIRDISRPMVQAKYLKLKKEKGLATANKTLSLVQVMMNHAKSDEIAPGERLITDNPCDILRERQLRKIVKARTTSITPDQLGEFVYHVNNVQKLSPTAYATSSLVLLLLLTGLRKEEGLQLRWENVNYVDKYLKVEDTKNGRDHYFPLSDWLMEVLADRIARTQYSGETELGSPESRAAALAVAQTRLDPSKVKLTGWVFPSEKTDGPLRGPDRHIADMQKRCGIPFKLHDLRRTFTSICHEIGVNPLSIKRLVNHKSRDITEGYIVTNIESLRQPAQQVAEYVQERYDAYLKTRFGEEDNCVLPFP